MPSGHSFTSVRSWFSYTKPDQVTSTEVPANSSLCSSGICQPTPGVLAESCTNPSPTALVVVTVPPPDAVQATSSMEHSPYPTVIRSGNPQHSPNPNGGVSMSTPERPSSEWIVPAYLLDPIQQLKQQDLSLRRTYSYYIASLWGCLAFIVTIALISVVGFPFRNLVYGVLVFMLVLCCFLAYRLRRHLKMAETHHDFLRQVITEAGYRSSGEVDLSVQRRSLLPPPPSYQTALSDPPAYTQLPKLPLYHSTRVTSNSQPTSA
ncbi:hypothetical protein IWQ61_004244 [Dispira simplex]|nr:hypothetical protein IWQ61_004244 [Dispira simplex]